VSRVSSASSLTTGGLAAKERLEVGSAYDGWSDGSELSILVTQASLDLEPGASALARHASEGLGMWSEEGAAAAAAAEEPPAGVSGGAQTDDVIANEAGGSPCAQMSGGCPPLEGDWAACTADAEFYSPGEPFDMVRLQRDSSTQTVPPPRLTLCASHTERAPWPRAASLQQGSGGRVQSTSIFISASSTLPEIQAALGGASKPAVHARPGGGLATLYAYRGVVFEVMPDGSLATVTLFKA
jgi:hypothetical protein